MRYPLRWFLICIGCAFFFIVGYTRAQSPAIYYVSPTGNDAHVGMSSDQPWQSLNRVNQGIYQPGDSILLQAGQTFNGAIYLAEANGQGTADAPITLGSYGDGRATIAAGDLTGIWIVGVGGYRLTNLNVTGTALTHGKYDTNGIHVYNPDPKRQHIVVENVEVSGFGLYCILVQGEGADSGYNGVWIIGAVVHDCGDTGIGFLGAAIGAVTNAYVGYSEAYAIPGFLVQERPSGGNGIFLVGVNGGVVEYSVAHDNGTDTTGGAPYGIWAYIANNITIQYNEVYNIHTGLSTDGGGYDLDAGVSNSVVQYNYSHDNDGPGLLLCGCQPNAGATNNNLFRYNISQNDGRKNFGSGIAVAGGYEMNNNVFYNNTIYWNKTDVDFGAAVGVFSSSGAGQQPYENLGFYNNILIAENGFPLIYVAQPEIGAGLDFQRNLYWSGGQPFQIGYGLAAVDENGIPHSAATFYNNLDAWASATGQELQEGAVTAYHLDPALCAPGQGGTLFPNPLTGLIAYQLSPESPAVDAGIDVAALFATNADTRDFVGPGSDFFGQPRLSGAGIDLGASEFQPEQTCA